MENRSYMNKTLGLSLRLLPLLALLVPIAILYNMDPASFERTWQGRTYYLFFLWLISLETILNWEKLDVTSVSKSRIRQIVLAAGLTLPTIYVVSANYYGLNSVIGQFARNYGYNDQLSFLISNVQLQTEYLVLAVTFAIIVLALHGIRNLKEYAVSMVFLGTIALIYTINNLYPWGRFAPFQMVVPTTTQLATNVLHYFSVGGLVRAPIFNYVTGVRYTNNDPTYGSLTSLTAVSIADPTKRANFSIAWPCSGVESLIIYTVVIALFLKNSDIRFWQKLVYFAFGAAVTYLINILRIATIFAIAANGGNWILFHDYYGQLLSISWIITYPMLILATSHLWNKLRISDTESKMPNEMKPHLSMSS